MLMMDYATYLDNLVDAAGQKEGFEPLSLGQIPASFIQHHTTFSTSGLGMQVVSTYIENQALQLAGPFKLYAGFQKLSRFLPQRHRYLQISMQGQPVFIFGEADAVLPAYSNLNVVYLDEKSETVSGGLHRYWFVVLQAERGLSMALLCRELSRSERATHKSNQMIYRNFEGFWTFDESIISQIAVLLDACIEEYGSI